MIRDMYGFYNMVKDSSINLIYSGSVWAEGIEGIAGTIKKRLAFDELPLSAAQSVFSVFIEQMNNILMYSAEKEHFNHTDNTDLGISTGVFALGSKDKVYFLQSGNMMKTENVGFIKERIDLLNTLDKIGLRKLYKEKIKSGDNHAESKGAGLGLIEIARRASSKIEYTFTPFENDLTFFSMFVTIGG